MPASKPTLIEIDTGYVIPGVLPPGGRMVHRLRVVYNSRQPDRGGELLLDPNACQLDEYGETRGCTRIAVRRHDAALRLVSRREGWRLFAVDAKGYEGPALRLAVHQPRGAHGPRGGRLLVLGADGGIAGTVAVQATVQAK